MVASSRLSTAEWMPGLFGLTETGSLTGVFSGSSLTRLAVVGVSAFDRPPTHVSRSSVTSLQPASTEDPDAYFVRLAPGSFRPTRHTTGAWSVTEQHVSPLNGLLVHAVDRSVAERAAGSAPDPLATARIAFDILGVVPIDEVEVRVEVVRPGRTIELLEAVAVSGGRPVLRARAWRLARHDTAVVAGGAPDALPPPDGRAGPRC